LVRHRAIGTGVECFPVRQGWERARFGESEAPFDFRSRFALEGFYLIRSDDVFPVHCFLEQGNWTVLFPRFQLRRIPITDQVIAFGSAMSAPAIGIGLDESRTLSGPRACDLPAKCPVDVHRVVAEYRRASHAKCGHSRTDVVERLTLELRGEHRVIIILANEDDREFGDGGIV